MMLRLRAIALSGAAVILTAAAALAQGVQTGTLRGVVLAASGSPASDATITIASPVLQGTRSTGTGTGGIYAFRGLPPGDYVVRVSVGGAERAQRAVVVPLDGVATLDVRLPLTGLAVDVDVVAPQLAAPTVRANFTNEEIDRLAHLRSLTGIARLAPGVSDAVQTPGPTVGQGQVAINGAFGYDNVFMINGVDVGDNIFGWPQNLFIEEAIAETQVLTSGVSAEYGRFGGGVVNAITRSGGNVFAGSYRVNLTNDAWSTETPFERAREVTRVSDVNVVHEGTFGGPLVQDRLWFFLAGRASNAETSPALPVTGAQYLTKDRNRRGELTITGTVGPGHTVRGSALGNPRTQEDQANFTGGLATIDPFALSDKARPNHLIGVGYTGAATARLLVEAHYSQQQFSTDAGGGTSTALVDSPFLTFDFTGQYNAPYFDGTDPDERNNRQFTASAAYFTGPHDIKAGYEWFRSQKIGGNSQSATGHVFYTDYVTTLVPDPDGGPPVPVPVLDANGRLQPEFLPGETLVFRYTAARGAQLDIDHHSAHVQDRWTVGTHVSANLGVRVERVTSRATGAAAGLDATRVQPRLAVSYDLRGDGAYVLHSTYAHYSGRYNDALFLLNTPVGNPSEVDGVYTGPAGAGRDFAPGFDPANYDFDGIFALFPTANVQFDPDLSSPLTREWTASAGVDLSGRGSVAASYVWRRTGDLVEDFISLANGTTHVVQPGVDLTLTNSVFRNTDLARRDYQAVLVQGRGEVRPDLTVYGNWTIQLENDGNYEGEAPNRIVTSAIGDYPEIFTGARHYPDGRLPGFQRHRVHVWGIHRLDLGRAGMVTTSGFWRYNSARTYSLRVPGLQPTNEQFEILDALGYPDSPSIQTVFYSARGSERFAGSGVVDAAVTYDVPVVRTYRPWVKVEVYNLFNNQTLTSWNTSIAQDPDTPLDALGFRTGFVPGPSFGQATSSQHYPVPFAGRTGGRTLRLAAGVRF